MGLRLPWYGEIGLIWDPVVISSPPQLSPLQIEVEAVLDSLLAFILDPRCPSPFIPSPIPWNPAPIPRIVRGVCKLSCLSTVLTVC